MCREFLRSRGSNKNKGGGGGWYIGPNIGYIAILDFCKKSLKVIKPAFIWSNQILIYFINLLCILYDVEL